MPRTGEHIIDITQLLHACQRNDPLAWEVLVKRYQGRIYALCYFYLHNAAEAEDLAQESFVRIYKGLATFSENAQALPAWMLAITRHCCIDRIRHKKSRLPESQAPDGDEVPEFLDEKAEDPAGEMQMQQEQRLLYRALQQASAENREMIMLKEIQGLKLEEISVLLNLPVGTVKSRSSRARLELAKIIMRLQPDFVSSQGMH